MHQDALTHLSLKLPHLREMFSQLSPVELPTKQEVEIPLAVTEIIVSQMLSGPSADVIFSRLIAKAIGTGNSKPWHLTEKEIMECGISRRKAFAIINFGTAFDSDPARFSDWPTLAHESLVREVSGFWGLSRWSADILGLSYFGNPDVFPASDGTLVRAIKAACANTEVGAEEWDIYGASPYRSLLARYLWKSIDTGFWQQSV